MYVQKRSFQHILELPPTQDASRHRFHYSIFRIGDPYRAGTTYLYIKKLGSTKNQQKNLNQRGENTSSLATLSC